LLLRPLPVRQPEQLIRLVQVVPQIGTASNFEHEVYDSLRGASTLAAVFGNADWRMAMDDHKPRRASAPSVCNLFFDTDHPIGADWGFQGKPIVNTHAAR
jgi:hypothetical protein